MKLLKPRGRIATFFGNTLGVPHLARGILASVRVSVRSAQRALPPYLPLIGFGFADPGDCDLVRICVLGFWIPLYCLFLCLTLGCHSTPQTGRTQFASVELRGNTPGQIRAVAIEVFKGDGYTLAPASAASEFILEKEGSGFDNIAYGNWVGTPIWVRFKVKLVPMGEGAFRLQGQAYLVRGRGEPAEEEIKIRHSAPYQKTLDQVAQRLHNHPASPSS